MRVVWGRAGTWAQEFDFLALGLVVFYAATTPHSSSAFTNTSTS